MKYHFNKIKKFPEVLVTMFVMSPDDGGRKDLRNAGKLRTDYMEL